MPTSLPTIHPGGAVAHLFIATWKQLFTIVPSKFSRYLYPLRTIFFRKSNVITNTTYILTVTNPLVQPKRLPKVTKMSVRVKTG
jgi:hypothetical protein